MKKVLTLLTLFVILFSSCSTTTVMRCDNSHCIKNNRVGKFQRSANDGLLTGNQSGWR